MAPSRLTSPPPSTPAVRQVMLGNVGRDTKPEVAVRSELHARGFRFRKHQRPVSSLRCWGDVVFPTEGVVVFVDGCFWHGCPIHGRRPKSNRAYWSEKIRRNKARDERQDVLLREAGWIVVRAWEHDPVKAVADRVESAVLARRNGVAYAAQNDLREENGASGGSATRASNA